MNSVKPNPLRPVGVTTGVTVVPLAINVPPLPSEMPCRISQVAPVMLVLARSSEKTDVTVHPPPLGTMKSSYTLANSPLPSEVLSSLASPLTPLKSPLYQSGPDVPGGHVGDPVGVGEGVGVPPPPVTVTHTSSR